MGSTFIAMLAILIGAVVRTSGMTANRPVGEVGVEHFLGNVDPAGSVVHEQIEGGVPLMRSIGANN